MKLSVFLASIIGFAFLSFSFCLCEGSKVIVDLAFYRPDRGRLYQWFEGAKDLQTFFTKDYRAAGAIHLYLANKSQQPISVGQLFLDGEKVEKLREEGSVVWWRVLPQPILPNSVSELVIRVRWPLDKSKKVSIELEDGTSLQREISPVPPKMRIETVGFNQKLDTVFIYLEKLTSEPLTVKDVFVDTEHLTQRTHSLAPKFFHTVAPVIIRLPKPLIYGSYHTFKVTTAEGTATACTVRAFDGFVILGTYGFSTLEEYARNGLNNYTCFGRLSKSDLDVMALLGLRGISALAGSGEPPAEIVGHSALLGYYLMDEPDCHDYGIQELPHPLRVGYYAMEMERRAEVCRKADLRNLTFLTMNLTYKPANWFIYGEIPDLLNTDAYPLSIGAEISFVREVVETARYGCAPRPLIFTYQSYFGEPKDAQAKATMRFPRPPFQEELRIMVYYAIGSGARGLINYIHCTEYPETYISHGTNEYPDLWLEIGRLYRELDLLSPLIAIAHPTKLATSNQSKLWTRLLLCGQDAALLVCVNEDYQSFRDNFKFNRLHKVQVSIPKFPWMDVKRALAVSESGFEPIRFGKQRDAIVLDLGELSVTKLVLLTNESALPEILIRARRERRTRQALGLQQVAEEKLRFEGEQAGLRRRIVADYKELVVLGNPVNAYGIERKDFWNPTGEKYNAIEWYEEKGTSRRGVQWKVSIYEDWAWKKHLLYVCGFVKGAQPSKLNLSDASGNQIFSKEVLCEKDKVWSFELEFPSGGEYTVELVQEFEGYKIGRVAKAAFLVPKERAK